jgi:diadenosine tetraphosphatase ApaH/serine/threonine PP2A family protein phosphatase
MTNVNYKTKCTIGFRDEIRQKYDSESAIDIWEAVGDAFAALPIAARTKSALILHGGLPSADFDLDSLAAIPALTRFEMKTTVDPKTPEQRLISGILWSDPTAEEREVVYDNPRGMGIVFGYKVAQDFLLKHDLRYLVRGHELVQNGVASINCGKGTSVITVFSAAAYPADEGSNMGAVLHLKADGTYQSEAYSFKDAASSISQSRSAASSEKIRSLIGCNKTKLEKAFQSFGQKITIDQWATVMDKTLDLSGIPWKNLQPTLAPTVDGRLIDWQEFLNSHSLGGLASSGKVDSNEAESLHENHDMLLTVFKFLDTNGDGTLSSTEFTTGVALMNKRLPVDRQLIYPVDLFRALDLDGNGEISFDEFKRGFAS